MHAVNEIGECLRHTRLQGVDIVFYGDSITETWRGSDQGAVSPRCSGVVMPISANSSSPGNEDAPVDCLLLVKVKLRH